MQDHNALDSLDASRAPLTNPLRSNDFRCRDSDMFADVAESSDCVRWLSSEWQLWSESVHRRNARFWAVRGLSST
jgi:hypothetical protein